MVNQLHQEIQERMARAVSRTVRHAEASGMKPGGLDGDMTLTIKDGQLVQITFPPSTPKGKPLVLDTLPAPVEPVVADEAAGTDESLPSLD